MSSQLALWIVFGALVPAVLALDLGVFHRKAHTIEAKEALLLILRRIGTYLSAPPAMNSGIDLKGS